MTEYEEAREAIAKHLYEYRYSEGYWDTRMNDGDKWKWRNEADQILQLIEVSGWMQKKPKLSFVENAPICPDCGVCGGVCSNPLRNIHYCQWDEYVQMAHNQDLPKHSISNQDRMGETYAYYYHKAQQDMLKANFKRVIDE